MRKTILILMLLAMLPPNPVLCENTTEIRLNVVQTLQMALRPVDIAVALNGRRVFALTEAGSLLIYSPDGRLEGSVQLGEGTDIIKATPRDDVLLAGNSREKTLRIITLDMIQEIDTSGLPVKGPMDAPFEIVVFSDFECPSCAELATALDQLTVEYPEQVKVVFMNYPLRSHRHSRAAAAAALAAGRQGRFWEFHDALFDNHDRLSPQKIDEIAQDLKLDTARLKREMSHLEVTAALNRDLTEAARLYVGGTPTVFVNGRILRNHSTESFLSVINRTAPGNEKQ
ncbi:thioredoxin domain-containing protein [Desulfococcus multivorans]|uniref:DsbA oxidoreductase n=1 Tax=Desulfococcus multivorans DSM 2059 TaxID=1121405 RepID=S7UUR1_DESML|nr:thioredoxin domain-containing protein [Desulfococcus multivorans]EPR37799.1 DsbA oxidoreductase [Desulfococcus multivorans DSM 2059]SJZ91786.1 Protein-disulfide isomerase [Desulfococcus multivorans DSM 2059]